METYNFRLNKKNILPSLRENTIWSLNGRTFRQAPVGSTGPKRWMVTSTLSHWPLNCCQWQKYKLKIEFKIISNVLETLYTADLKPVTLVCWKSVTNQILFKACKNFIFSKEIKQQSISIRTWGSYLSTRSYSMLVSMFSMSNSSLDPSTTRMKPSPVQVLGVPSLLRSRITTWQLWGR